MRKISVILTFALILAVALSLLVSADPDKKAIVSYGTPNIGGNTIDPVWDSVQGYKINEDNADSITDTVSEWKIMWDENRMYFLVNVTDSHVNSQSETWWQNDCSYLIIDFANSGDFDTYFYDGSGTAIGMRFAVPGVIQPPDNFVMEFMGSGEYLEPTDPLYTDIIKYVRVTGTGYVMEYSLDPKKYNPNFKLEAGSKGGLDFVNDDSIDVADRAVYYSWSADGGTWSDPKNLSVFELAAKIEVPVEEKPAETVESENPVAEANTVNTESNQIAAPKTGDTSIIILVMIAALSASVAVMLKKRKKFE